MPDKSEAHNEVEAMLRQFAAGAHVAVDMVKDGQLSFEKWCEAVTTKKAGTSTPLDDLRLIWVWDSLRQDPALRDVFEHLSPAGVRWNRNSQPVLVVNRESWFVIGLSRNETSGLLSPRSKPPQEELAAFQLLGELYMRPGRNDRLECCDCPCLLQLRPSEVYSQAREMDILGVGAEQIRSLDSGLIQIEVPSINQAYTVASRRLEPERRSHGGSIYEHVVYIGDQERRRLEEVRLAVEHGAWKVPSPNRETSSERLLFPKDSP